MYCYQQGPVSSIIWYQHDDNDDDNDDDKYDNYYRHYDEYDDDDCYNFGKERFKVPGGLVLCQP